MTQLDFTNIMPLGAIVVDLNVFRTYPRSEASRYKNIPIQWLKPVQERLRKTCPKGYHIRYRFRGPRYDFTRGFTAKKDANRFSVYYCPKVRSWH